MAGTYLPRFFGAGFPVPPCGPFVAPSGFHGTSSWARLRALPLTLPFFTGAGLLPEALVARPAAGIFLAIAASYGFAENGDQPSG